MSQKIPSCNTALAAPAQLPAPESGAGTTTYRINALGQRVRKNTPQAGGGMIQTDYHYDQNDYHSAKNSTGEIVRAPCSNNGFAQCSGNLDAFSLVADYRFTKRFDAYAGVMYSKVADGLSNGYLHDNNTNLMTGLRFQF